ncbi:MAG TPA: CBS domain-containing protein [Actinomycetes bacterium]|nr:CBS domain-containing protein [Actinomycetes bacterium]
MKVKEIMTTPVVAAGPDTPTADVAELLTRHKISGVPVTDEAGAVVGLVSEYDLLVKQGATARELMSPTVISVTEDTDVEHVRALLVDMRIRRVPVLAGQQLVGIVSRSDLVELLALEWTCEVCGEPVRGQQPPDQCPRCGQPTERFTRQEQPPGE